MIRVNQELTINYNIIVSLTYCPYRGLMMNTMNSKIPKTNPYSDGDAPFFSACEKELPKNGTRVQQIIFLKLKIRNRMLDDSMLLLRVSSHYHECN